MSAAVTPTRTDLYETLRAFILSLLGTDVQVIDGLGNRVAMPLGGFVAITTIRQRQLATNVDTYTDPYPTAGGAKTLERSTEVMIQVDCYGPSSFDWAIIISEAFRDDVGCLALAPTCQPLYCEEPHNVPLINGEEQYEERWLIGAILQYNAIISTPQQFAGALGLNIINVDEAYPP